MLVTDNEIPWWEYSEMVTLTAQFLASEGVDPWLVVSVYETPWEHTEDYRRAWKALTYIEMP